MEHACSSPARSLRRDYESASGRVGTRLAVVFSETTPKREEKPKLVKGRQVMTSALQIILTESVGRGINIKNWRHITIAFRRRYLYSHLFEQVISHYQAGKRRR